jgi:hypothetical protein
MRGDYRVYFESKFSDRGLSNLRFKGLIDQSTGRLPLVFEKVKANFFSPAYLPGEILQELIFSLKPGFQAFCHPRDAYASA